MISQEVEGTVHRGDGEVVAVPFTAEFTYDPDTDPIGVRIVFSCAGGDAEWAVARELLVRGIASPVPYGKGDFKLRFAGPGTGLVLFCLRSPEGHADLSVDHAQLAAFLDAIEAVLPLGSECMDDLLDEALKEILGS